MNRARLYLCCVTLLAPVIAGAATADYVYGMPLDVARVLSVDEAPSIPARWCAPPWYTWTPTASARCCTT